ncbi:hypothetical protein, partial [Escherichia coli]|uniref:hypothetical protein n=1 Tax=Escherichia coli TaxID=562 RepID=UPI0028A26088
VLECFRLEFCGLMFLGVCFVCCVFWGLGWGVFGVLWVGVFCGGLLFGGFCGVCFWFWFWGGWGFVGVGGGGGFGCLGG